ncbi:hypothetical protein JRO89_XS04G0268300 [Xanthoceras sorbifolium]|uniref:Calcium-transporting P-type ATPase N-terminal autoinhibitory domain-containing protein n=1 Tax=Xanthoceras sorbifolium TaxID=99658 RepID=A0ABQ8I7I9_9ROSI|nr:hypothetical protein JRO89_XS04G0268300 [Xanthoceras sorbifolium]
MEMFKASPNRRRHDFEVGNTRSDEDENPFDIPPTTNNASIDSLRRWRKAALVLNTSRRFRLTLDLKNGKEKQQALTKIRAHAQAIRAAYDFQQEAARQSNGTDNLKKEEEKQKVAFLVQETRRQSSGIFSYNVGWH